MRSFQRQKRQARASLAVLALALLMVSISIAFPDTSPPEGPDFTRDGTVDEADLIAFVKLWQKSPSSKTSGPWSNGDLTGDAKLTSADARAMLDCLFGGTVRAEVGYHSGYPPVFSPFSDATVKLLHAGRLVSATHTSASGWFLIPGLPAGSYVVRIPPVDRNGATWAASADYAFRAEAGVVTDLGQILLAPQVPPAPEGVRGSRGSTTATDETVEEARP